MRNRVEYTEDIAVGLGGYAAEKIIFGEVTTGASSDMQQITKTAKSMVTQWGMSEVLGPRVYGERADMIFLGREITENRDYSESRAERIDQEIDSLINEGLVTAKKIVTEHRAAMDRIVEHLMKHEIIERDDFAKVVGLPPANPKANLPRAEA